MTPRASSPPALAVWLIGHLVPEVDRESLLGDLEESFRARVAGSGGWRAARRWYWRQALRAILALRGGRRIADPLFAQREGTMRDLLPDVRYAVRQLTRAPFFSSISIALLAVGIGVNAALFSVIDTRIARPIPGIPEPDGLVQIEPRGGDRLRRLTYAEFLELRERQTVFTDIAAGAGGGSVTVDIGEGTHSANIVLVSGSYFSVMRPEMEAGTPLPPFDDRGGSVEPAVIVSYLFWRTRLDGDPAAVGRTIRVNRVPLTVVGVLPRGFDVPDGVPNNMDLWLPFDIDALIRPPRDASAPRPMAPSAGRAIAELVARLRPEVSQEQAVAAVDATLAAIGGMHRPESPLTGAVVARMGALGGEFVTGSAIILNVTFLILAIACANVSILLLGRAVVRRREIAVRLALGARRLRVVRLLIVESVLLSLIACAGGILVAHWICEFFNARFPFMGMDYALSWRSIAVTVAFAGATGILFGLTPALHATRTGVSDALKTGGAATDRQRSRLQRTFVVAEVAMGMALVCAAWLLVQSYGGLGGATFELSNRVLIADIGFSRATGGASYSPERADAILSAARGRIAARPGVEQVSFGTGHPLSERTGYGLIAPAQRLEEVDARHAAGIAVADPDYFRAAGVPLHDGRGLERTDSAGSSRVVVVGEAVAARLWPDRRAVGNVLMIGQRRQMVRGGAADTTFLPYTVIGVVGEPRSYTGTSTIYGRPIGSVYIARLQLSPTEGPRSSRDMTLVVRTSGPATDLAPAIIQELRALDADLPVTGVGTTRSLFNQRNREEVAMSNGISLAGLISLLMACVGIYAVIAFGVNQRTREIGIRMALGARKAQIVSLFFRDGLRLALLGFVIGIPLSLIVMRFSLGGQSARVLTIETVLTIIAVLLSVAALASWLPARRAAGVDPMSAARNE